MNDLDEKLRAILDQLVTTVHNSGVRGDSFDYILQYIAGSQHKIKQAFAKEGYIQVKMPTTTTMLIDLETFIDAKPIDFTQPSMTGQEWYDRFEKEIKGVFSTKAYIEAIDKAAMRAARLADE